MYSPSALVFAFAIPPAVSSLRASADLLPLAAARALPGRPCFVSASWDSAAASVVVFSPRPKCPVLAAAAVRPHKRVRQTLPANTGRDNRAACQV